MYYLVVFLLLSYVLLFSSCCRVRFLVFFFFFSFVNFLILNSFTLLHAKITALGSHTEWAVFRAVYRINAYSLRYRVHSWCSLIPLHLYVDCVLLYTVFPRCNVNFVLHLLFCALFFDSEIRFQSRQYPLFTSRVT